MAEMTARELSFNVHHCRDQHPNKCMRGRKTMQPAGQALKLCRVSRLQTIREDRYCLGNLKVPAVLSWQNLLSKTTGNNHHPSPLEQQRATTI